VGQKEVLGVDEKVKGLSEKMAKIDDGLGKIDVAMVVTEVQKSRSDLKNDLAAILDEKIQNLVSKFDQNMKQQLESFMAQVRPGNDDGHCRLANEKLIFIAFLVIFMLAAINVVMIVMWHRARNEATGSIITEIELPKYN
jgi:hypothetical protein